MRYLRVLVVVALATTVAVPATARHGGRCKPLTKDHAVEAHSSPRGHARLCHEYVLGSVEVTKTGGLGQIDIHRGKLAAVVQRDEGMVALVDISRPSAPKVVGRYEDDVNESLDGDVAFSSDGDWLFYARQTRNFDEDGVHVLNITDRAAPTLTQYQPGGGAFRIEYHKDDAGEWVILLDAIDGLVVYQFVRETGTLVKVFQDAAPALKVGGPASAGLFVSKKDPMTDTPLLYVTTGRTGLQVYDFSDPVRPSIVGEWDRVGLADLDVRDTKKKRIVYAATEYWFDKTLPPRVLVLDATKLESIEKRRTHRLRVPAVDDFWRVQGIDRTREGLYVAHSHAGVIRFRPRGITGVASVPRPHNEAAGYNASPYAMDVVMDRRGYHLVSDASSGTLSVLVPYYGPLPVD